MRQQIIINLVLAVFFSLTALAQKPAATAKVAAAPIALKNMEALYSEINEFRATLVKKENLNDRLKALSHFQKEFDNDIYPRAQAWTDMKEKIELGDYSTQLRFVNLKAYMAKNCKGAKEQLSPYFKDMSDENNDYLRTDVFAKVESLISVLCKK